MTSRAKQRILITEATSGADALWIDVPKLVRTRLIVQAGSGAGKSYTLKRILEQSHGSIQHIIIDPEGEFASLREKFDYVLAGKEGETPADPRGAKLLAERLLELKASAILDLYELKQHDRIDFVRQFLDSMVNAPKHLWHPVLLVIDEAHIFCPQQDRSESASASAVIDLLTRGRKRGFCAILATQRLSKLHKDAAAECQNKLLGLTTLDVDMKRVGDELGFSSREQRLSLRDLSPGEFYAFGPAMTRTVTKIKVGPVMTRVPSTRSRRLEHVPPPTNKIKKLLPSLADIPAEADQRELTQRELKHQLSVANHKVRDLEKTIAAGRPKPIKPRPIFDTHSRRWLNDSLRKAQRVLKLKSTIDDLSTALLKATQAVEISANIPTLSPAGMKAFAPIDRKPRALVPVPAEVKKLLDGEKAERRIAAALKDFPNSTAQRVGSLAGVTSKRSTFRLAISRLRKAGVIEGDTSSFRLTDLGVAATIDFESRPTGDKLVDYWRIKLANGAVRDIFEALLKAGRAGASSLKLEAETGLDPKVSTFRVAIANLRHRGLISGNSERWILNEDLFGVQS